MKILNDSTLHKKVTFIKVNADLQASWGLIAGERVKLQFKLKRKKGTIVMGKMPVKN